MGICMWVQGPWRPEESIVSLGSGVTGSCELGTELRSCTRAVSALNYSGKLFVYDWTPFHCRLGSISSPLHSPINVHSSDCWVTLLWTNMGVSSSFDSLLQSVILDICPEVKLLDLLVNLSKFLPSTHKFFSNFIDVHNVLWLFPTPIIPLPASIPAKPPPIFVSFYCFFFKIFFVIIHFN